MSKVSKKKHVFIRISLRLGNFFSLELDHVKSSILQYLRGIARSSRTKSCVIKSYLLLYRDDAFSGIFQSRFSRDREKLDILLNL